MRFARQEKRQSKKARSERAKARANETGYLHYEMSPETIGFCHRQIRTSKSGFVMRWGKLNIHRVLCEAGTVFAAYDTSIKLISFFIPKHRGLAIAKGKKSAAWGNCKRSGVLLLPPLVKKPPPRVHEQHPPEEAGAVPDQIGEVSELTKSEVKVIKGGVTTRIKFLQDRVDVLMQLSPMKHWDEITAIGERIEELEAMRASLPEGVPDPTGSVPDCPEDPQHARRHAIITELGLIEQEMLTCSVGDLVDKSNKLADLKKELFQLIPNEGAIDRREALYQATTRLRDEIEAFQAGRQYGKGVDLTADRKKMAGLRKRLRALLSMHQALFGTSYFLEDAPEPTPMEPEEPANEPPQLTGVAKVEARYDYVNERIHAIDLLLKTAEAGEANRLHHHRLILVRELGTIPTKAECAALSEEEIDRILLLRRILALRGYIKWFMHKHNVHKGPAKEHLVEVHEQFDDLVFEYNDRYPESLKENDGPPPTTETLPGTGL